MPDLVAPAFRMGIFSDQIDQWEAAPLALLAQFLRPDDIVVEAGTGAGATALAAAQIARRVVTCDPHPDVAWWMRIAELPENVEYRQCALATMDGEIAFHINSEFWNSAGNVNGNLYGDFTETILVPAISIQVLIRQESATFVVLDVEGAETSLLPAVASCPTVRAILVEFHPYKSSYPFAAPGFAARETIPDGLVKQVYYEREQDVRDYQAIRL